MTRIARESVGEHTAGRPGPDDDEIEVGHSPPLVEASSEALFDGLVSDLFDRRVDALEADTLDPGSICTPSRSELVCHDPITKTRERFKTVYHSMGPLRRTEPDILMGDARPETRVIARATTSERETKRET